MQPLEQEIMKNRFFSIALSKAAFVGGKPTRILLLLLRLAVKIKDTNWKSANSEVFKAKLATIARLAKAYAQGHYRDISWKTMLSILAVIIYFINPFDLLPDVIPLLEFTDDFGVLLWVYNASSNEMRKFIAWEQTKQLPEA